MCTFFYNPLNAHLQHHLLWMPLTHTTATKIIVERLIRQWAPVVWLAPEEKFLPLGVDEFLHYVHAVDRDSSVNTHHHHQEHYYSNNIERAGVEVGAGTASGMTRTNDVQQDFRPKSRRGSMIMPLGEFSKKSYLVTNGDIGE